MRGLLGILLGILLKMSSDCWWERKLHVLGVLLHHATEQLLLSLEMLLNGLDVLSLLLHEELRVLMSYLTMLMLQE